MNIRSLYFRKTIGVLLACVVLATAIVFAFNSMNSVNAQTAPADPPPGSNLDQRVAQRKAEREIVLDERDSRRVETRCVRSQARVRQLQLPKTQMLDNRDSVYASAYAKVWVAVGSIRLANQDTFTLERYRLQFEGELTTFRKTVNNFKEVMEDMLQMNCEADIIGYMSLVETIRIYEQQLADQSVKIRQTITVEIREELANLTRSLQPQSVEAGGTQ